MTKNLVEHIIDEEYVEASDVFAGTLSSILEQKLYEMKRSIDLTEVVKKTRKKNEDGSPVYTGYNTKADWAKYRKQNPQMSFHGTPANPKAKAPAEKKEKTSTGTITSYGLKQRRKRGYLPASDALNAVKFIDAVKKYKETGKLDEGSEDIAFGPLRSRAREQEKADTKPKGSQKDTATADTWDQPAGKVTGKSGMDVNKLSSYGKRGGSTDPSGIKYLDPNKMSRKRNPVTSKGKVAGNNQSTGQFIKRQASALLTGKNRFGKSASRIQALGNIRKILHKNADYQTIRGRSDSGSVGAKVINRGMKFASNVFSTPWQEESYQMQEVLGPGASAVDYIHDFEKSKDSRFKGDSKEKRRKRAIAAYMHNKNKLEEAAWKDISKEKKKHPFGKPQNILKKRRRKFARRIFNEE